jgi:phenylalanine-4-hydroxylase
LQDFAPIYDRLSRASDIPIERIEPTDLVITRGTQAYARGRAAAAQ